MHRHCSLVNLAVCSLVLVVNAIPAVVSKKIQLDTREIQVLKILEEEWHPLTSTTPSVTHPVRSKCRFHSANSTCASCSSTLHLFRGRTVHGMWGRGWVNDRQDFPNGDKWGDDSAMIDDENIHIYHPCIHIRKHL